MANELKRDKLIYMKSMRNNRNERRKSLHIRAYRVLLYEECDTCMFYRYMYFIFCGEFQRNYFSVLQEIRFVCGF